MATKAKPGDIARSKRKMLVFVEDEALGFVAQHQGGENDAERNARKLRGVPWNLLWILRCECRWSHSTVLGSGVTGEVVSSVVSRSQPIWELFEF